MKVALKVTTVEDFPKLSSIFGIKCITYNRLRLRLESCHMFVNAPCDCEYVSGAGFGR